MNQPLQEATYAQDPVAAEQRDGTSARLRFSDQQFRALIENALDLIAILDREGMMLYVSPSVERVLGYGPDDLIGRSLFALVHPDDLPGTLQAFRESIAQGGPRRWSEYRFRRSDGSWRFLESDARSWLDRPDVRGVVVNSRDVTEARLAQERLVRSERQLAAAQALAHVGSWEWDLANNQFICSDEMARLLGLEPDQEISYDEFVQRLHPDDRERTRQTLEAVRCRHQPFNFTQRFVHPDGSVRVVISFGGMVLDNLGQTVRVFCACQDVTERRRQEDALRRERQFSERLIESSVDGILAFDRNYAYTIWNPGMERLTGLKKQDVLGRQAFDVVPFWKESGEDAFYRQALAGEHVVAKDRSFGARGDEPEGFFEGYYSPLRSETGAIIGGLAIIRDITEKKQLEMQMQHAQKLETLGVLAGGIAHDFNNLLMVILGNAELAGLQLEADSPSREFIGQIETAATRAADLCKQMLAYSGKGKFAVRPVDLSSLVQEMANLLEIAVAKKGTLTYELAEDLPAIEADSAQIQQVVMNLITNAADAVEPGNGEVRVQTHLIVADADILSRCYCDSAVPEGLYVCLEVSDNGCGMDDETQSRVFDPFFTTKFTGRGLGMAAVLGIIRGHRGAIQMTSAPGRGTTIRVLIPPSVQAPRSFAKEPPALDEWRAEGTVLVVDDEEMVLSVAKAILTSVGFQVETAGDGRQAVEIFERRSNEIDLVLMDMTMPYMSGEETFLQLKRLDPNVRVVMASGYSEHEATSHLTSRRMSGFIQKPYRAAELVAKLRGLLER
ncbi:MAG TPA: PAS domain S-box protein [Pirellulales bacterium]|nr:PAS domain S-box protein [Pirellulales bacterium]